MEFQCQLNRTKLLPQNGIALEELEEVNRDLTSVIDRERHTSVESVASGSSSESIENSSVSLDGSEPELSRDFYYSAVQNLEMAGLAYEEFMMILTDIKMSTMIEQKELVCRASSLSRESEMFQKMSPEALARLKNHLH